VYCSWDCHEAHWRGPHGHKRLCGAPQYVRVIERMSDGLVRVEACKPAPKLTKEGRRPAASGGVGSFQPVRRQ